MAKELTGVKLYVDWTAAQERANIATGAKSGGQQGEALATSLGKISKWFTDIENTGIFGNNVELTDTTYTFTNGTDGSFSVISDATGATSQTVRVLPTTAVADKGKVLMVNASGAPVYTEQAWIENTVDNLTNYYRKYVSGTTEKNASTYSAEEIDSMVSTIPRFAIEVVQALPTQDISDTTIYLVSNSGSGTNVYDEYIHVNNNWELIGTTEVDLTNYVQTTDVTTGESGVGTFKVKNTTITVYGLGNSAGLDVTDSTTGITASSTDSTVATAKAVFDFVDAIDTGVSSVSGTTGQIEVDTTTGDVTVNLADTAVTAGNYGSASAVTEGDTTGGTVNVPTFTVDAKGRITAASNTTVTLAGNDKTTQTTITGDNLYYPLLMGNTGAATGGSGAITTTTETAGTKKTGRLYAQVGTDGVTTLHSDIFVGLAATHATATNDNKLATTAFVHNVVDALDTGVTSVSGTSGRTTVTPAGGTGNVAVDLATVTVSTSDTNASFKKLTVDGYGRVTGTAAVTAADVRGLTPYTGTAGQITVGNDGAIGLTTAGTAVTDGFKKITTDAYGRVTATSDVAASDVKGLTGIDMVGATASAAGTKGMVPAPAAGDEGKFLTGAGTWATPENDNTTYTLSGTTTSGTNLVVTLTPSSGAATTATIPTFTGATASAAGAIGLVPAAASGDTNKWLKSNGTWTTLPITNTYTAGDTTQAITAKVLDDVLADLIIHCTA